MDGYGGGVLVRLRRLAVLRSERRSGVGMGDWIVGGVMMLKLSRECSIGLSGGAFLGEG